MQVDLPAPEQSLSLQTYCKLQSTPCKKRIHALLLCGQTGNTSIMLCRILNASLRFLLDLAGLLLELKETPPSKEASVEVVKANDANLMSRVVEK